MDPLEVVRTRRFAGVLVLSALVGVAASLAAWCFLELVHQIQVGVFYDGAPEWWPLPVLAAAGVLVALAIVRLPGTGGHVPAYGLNAGTTQPVELPGVILAAVAGIGLGIVLGPEAPLIALGSGLGLLSVRLVRRDAPEELGTVLAAAGTFAAMSLIFDSPLLAAVILIEASGLGGPKLPLVLLPGLLAAGIGSLVSIGMGSFTGLSSSDYALGALQLPSFARPDIADFGWSIALAAAVAAGAFVIVRLARDAEPHVRGRLFVALPAIGLVVAGLGIAFEQIAGESSSQVLFDGQDALGSLIAGAPSWSLGTLALLIACKGLAWSLSMAGFRGGPTFPAIYLGVAAGLLAAHLPGFAETPAVAVGIAAAIAAVLRLPLSAVVLAVVLTAESGAGAMPLIIVGAVVAYVTTAVLDGWALPERTHARTAVVRPRAGEA